MKVDKVDVAAVGLSSITMLFLIFALVLPLLGLSGCGLFVKKVDAWGLVVEFPEGLSVGASANAVDHVIDRKGLNVEKKAERY